MVPPKRVRLQELFRRLMAAPAAASFDEAYQQLVEVQDAVEDELTGIPRNPENWQSDGRLYPPQFDMMREVAGCPSLKRFRTREHNVFIGDNGAVEIRTAFGGEVVYSKAGADGRGVRDHERDSGIGE